MLHSRDISHCWLFELARQNHVRYRCGLWVFMPLQSTRRAMPTRALCKGQAREGRWLSMLYSTWGEWVRLCFTGKVRNSREGLGEETISVVEEWNAVIQGDSGPEGKRGVTWRIWKILDTSDCRTPWVAQWEDWGQEEHLRLWILWKGSEGMHWWACRSSNKGGLAKRSLTQTNILGAVSLAS